MLPIFFNIPSINPYTIPQLSMEIIKKYDLDNLMIVKKTTRESIEKYVRDSLTKQKKSGAVSAPAASAEETHKVMEQVIDYLYSCGYAFEE